MLHDSSDLAALSRLFDEALDLAPQLGELARRAFAAQPGVSPYFKAPLVKLEQSLRGHATG